MSVTVFFTDHLNALSCEAKQSVRARQHHNIHETYEESCQRLFNAIQVNSYIRPHRHSLDPKTETLIAVRGVFALITFYDDGCVEKIVRFGTEKYQNDKSNSVGVELQPGTWHTILALVSDSILFELKAGPFNPQAAKEFALWAPEEDCPEEAQAYLQTLHSMV
jgi:cupin fold WbuC family metalloprotein